MRVFDIGARDGQELSDRLLTVPNLLSFARLLILPVLFFDLAIEPHAHLRAFVLLAIFAATDWFDGYLARRLDQMSRLGTLLDPISDRLMVVVVGVGMVMGDLLPLWAFLVLLVRDLVVVAGGGLLLARGQRPPAVTRTGKAATFGLMTALPLFILAAVMGAGADDPHPVVLALAWFTYGTNAVLYYVAAVQYIRVIVGGLQDEGDGSSEDVPTG